MTAKTLTELPSPVPADGRVDVKNVKTMDSPDGYALSATLYFDGKRVAEVWNDGNGGPNMNSPLGTPGTPAFAKNREALKAAQAYADKWQGEEVREYSENLDLLVEELMSEKDLAKQARKLRSDRFPVVVVGFGEPYRYDDGDEDEELKYGFAQLVASVSLDSALDRLRAKDDVVAYRVLS